jgi:SAM-dependent methyltransferase
MEDARCPLCGCDPNALVRQAQSWLDDVEGTFDVRACPVCRMWITSPRPGSEDLWKVYPAGYHKVRVKDRKPEPGTPARGKLLDVGCGVGDAMALSRAQGWQCVGIEISPEAAGIARDRGFEVVVSDVLTVDWPDDRFNHIRCWHVLEHVVSPTRLLELMRDAINPGGSIEIVVPNRASAMTALFRRRWYHLDIPRHLYHFRPRDIRALAGSVGLRVVGERHTANSSGILGSLDILLAGSGRRDPHLRSKNWLRSAARAISWPIAKARFGDVVEYRLRVR